VDFAPVAQLDRVADFESEITPFAISQKPGFRCQEQGFCEFKRRPDEGQKYIVGAHVGARLVTLLARSVHIDSFSLGRTIRRSSIILRLVQASDNKQRAY